MPLIVEYHTRELPITLKEMTMDLLQEIAHCPNVTLCMAHPHGDHPCTQIVLSQGIGGIAEHQVPEPWSGHLETSPILFLSSNPSIGDDKDYFPRLSWPNERIADYFSNRFGGGTEEWIRGGTHPLISEGVYSQKAVAFWSAIRSRAFELLERPVNPGIDYAISEVVHCKSRSEIGVNAAFQPCVERYLRRIVSESGATVVVGLGTYAARAVRKMFEIPLDERVHGPIHIGGRDRYFTFLPHPAAFMPKTFTRCLSEGQVEHLRSVLKQR